MISFIQGFYPPLFQDDIVNFITGTSNNEPLNPNPYGCLDLQKSYEKFISTNEFNEKRIKSQKIQKPLFDYLNLTMTDQNWMWLGDWLYSYICNNQSIPNIITKEMFELAINDTLYYDAKFFEKFPLESSGSIWRLVFEHLDLILTKKVQYKFSLFSGHDTTILAILISLGYININEIPPYRSHLLMEIYQDKEILIRFIFNGKLILINNEEFISLSNLKLKLINSLNKCLF